MAAPYRTDEIAMAVVELGRRAGIDVTRLTVHADEAERVWVVEREIGGERRRDRFPFATARGIYTPGEIARLVLGESWPFD